MNKKIVMIFIGILLLIGSFVTIKYYLNSKAGGSSSVSTPLPIDEQETAATKVDVMPSPTTVLPTFPPLGRTITRIDSNLIVVYDKEAGEMQITKDPAKVKVFRRVLGNLVPATFDDLREGQGVTLNIVPRVSAEIIIEP